MQVIFGYRVIHEQQAGFSTPLIERFYSALMFADVAWDCHLPMILFAAQPITIWTGPGLVARNVNDT